MYTFAITVLLGLALFKIVDVLEDLAPGLTKMHGLVTVILGVAGVYALDYSLFEGWRTTLREDWMETFCTGIIVAGTTSLWRAGFHWLGSSEGEEPEKRHTHSLFMRRAA